MRPGVPKANHRGPNVAEGTDCGPESVGECAGTALAGQWGRTQNHTRVVLFVAACSPITQDVSKRYMIVAPSVPCIPFPQH